MVCGNSDADRPAAHPLWKSSRRLEGGRKASCLGRVAKAASSANEANAPPPTIPADVEAAAEDEWDQRRARDRVTTAKDARGRTIRSLRLDMEWQTMTGTLLAERQKLEGTARPAGNQQDMVRRRIALAEKALKAIPEPAPDAGPEGIHR